MSLKARKARDNDPFLLAPNLRQADLQEIQAAHDTDPLGILIESYELSSPCFTIVTEEKDIAGMFGVAATANPDVGAVWLMGSDLLAKHSVSFLRQSHAWVEELHKKYPILWNFADKRNKLHIGWLKWIGCNLVGETIRGVENRPFIEFLHL